MNIKSTLCTITRTPAYVFTIIALACFTALAAAFIAEGFLGLEPCKLCIYQRYPFALGLCLGLIGIALRKNTMASVTLLIICGLGFLGNSITAFYHTGVELHWWVSAVEGCTVTFENDSASKSLLENIMSAPMGDCSKIPWADPIFGLSMANYNIPFCLGLFLFCMMASVCIKKKHQEA